MTWKVDPKNSFMLRHEGKIDPKDWRDNVSLLKDNFHGKIITMTSTLIVFYERTDMALARLMLNG